MNEDQWQWWIQDFHGGGKPIILAKISRKLDENENKLRGGGRPWYPLGSTKSKL